MKKDLKGKREKENKRRNALATSFITGAIALVFLIVGYQIALFMNRAVQKKLGSGHSTDTVYVVTPAQPPQDPLQASSSNDKGQARTPGKTSGGSCGTSDGRSSGGGRSNGGSSNGWSSGGRTSGHGTSNGWSSANDGTDGSAGGRIVENFDFDPNTISVEDLCRLGFSQRQAQSIDNYRSKGGRFHRPSDFARSYVVADSVFRRLEPHIRIPKTDLNKADSAAFTALPGIGAYFARKMVEHRKELGGYSYTEQLMDIYRFDSEKFNAIEDLVTVDPGDARPYPLWTLPEDSLSRHPYIGSYAAHGIVLYREHNDVKDWTVEGLDKAGILRPGMAEKLARCRIAQIALN